MKDILVSIIVPTYNCLDYIDKCMDSLLNQTYSNIEIVICDDCSTDGTREALQKYVGLANVTVLYNDSNMKQAYTRNKCLENCNGEFVMMQDADDLAESNRVEELLSAFEPNIDFVSSGCYWFDEKGRYRDWIFSTAYPQRKSLLWGIPHVHAATMFRKECLQAIGGYRTGKHLSRAEDYDLIMNLYAAGYHGKNIPDLLYGYRVDRDALERRTFGSRIDECFIRAHGFKANKILLPFGWCFIFKPILAHVCHLGDELRRNRRA